MSGAEEIKQEEEQKVEQEQPAAEQPGNKRKLEAAAGEAEDQPAAKAVKTEEAAGEGAPEAAATDADMAEPTPEAAAEPAEPVPIGYKTFATGKEGYKYFHGLIGTLRRYQNLNEYEFHMVHELIKKGHPEAARKLAGGVRAIQIREVEIGASVTSCFFLLHEDGTDEDVSYRKCLATLFPDLSELAAGNLGGKAHTGARGGRGGGGRGGGGRGRGGRGGGRGGRGRGRN